MLVRNWAHVGQELEHIGAIIQTCLDYLWKTAQGEDHNRWAPVVDHQRQWSHRWVVLIVLRVLVTVAAGVRGSLESIPSVTNHFSCER